MRILLSALLAASVSFTAFTPAQACISACGGGGGSSSSSSSSGGESSSSDESSTIDQYSGQSTSAIDVFLDSLNFDAMNPSVTLEQALAELRNMRDAEADYERALGTYVRYDTTNIELHRADFSGWLGVVGGFLQGLFQSREAVARLEGQIVARWGLAALNQA